MSRKVALPAAQRAAHQGVVEPERRVVVTADQVVGPHTGLAVQVKRLVAHDLWRQGHHLGEHHQYAGQEIARHGADDRPGDGIDLQAKGHRVAQEPLRDQSQKSKGNRETQQQAKPVRPVVDPLERIGLQQQSRQGQGKPEGHGPGDQDRPERQHGGPKPGPVVNEGRQSDDYSCDNLQNHGAVLPTFWVSGRATVPKCW